MDVFERKIVYYAGASRPRGGSGGGGTSQGVFVGYVNENYSSMPSTRLDGSPLQNEDYVKVDAGANLPFTIGDITFNSTKDKAYYINNKWYLEAGVIQETKETPLSNPQIESLNNKSTQAQANAEFVERLKEVIKKVETDTNNRKITFTKYDENKFEILNTLFLNDIKQAIDPDNPKEDKVVSEKALETLFKKYIKKPDVAPGRVLYVCLDEQNREMFLAQAKGIYVGEITNGGSFPTKRLDGTDLENEDYVIPSSESTFPFTIDNITFNGTKDRAFYIDGKWYLEPGLLQYTNETPLKQPVRESLNGDKTTQEEVNIENVRNTKELVFEFNTPSTQWNISHLLNKFPSIRLLDNNGKEIYGTITYTTSNNIRVDFNINVSGKAIVN